MVGVNEITAGRSTKQRKKRADSEPAKWDFNHLPRLAANWSGSHKEQQISREKGKFCTEVLAWELWCAASGAVGHQFPDFIDKPEPQQAWAAGWAQGLGSRKARKHWKEAELPSVVKVWDNVWDQGEGNSVAVHKTLLLQCPCPG